MSYTRKIAHNTIIQIVGKGVSTVIGVVVIAMLTRYLGAAGFGQYTTIMAFLQLFGVLVDLGLYIILVKKISEPQVDEAAIASNIFTLRLISAIIFLGLAPVIALFFPYPALVKWGIALTSFSFLGITLNQALSGIFQKHLRMDWVVISEVLGRLVLVAATWLAIKSDLGLLWIMGAVVGGSLINFAFTFYFSRKLVRLRLAFDFRLWRQIIIESWPIALSIAFNLIYFKADTIILSIYHPAAVVGIYGAANKVLEVLVTMPAIFAGLVLPLLTAAWVSRDHEKFQRVLNKSFQAMAVIAMPLMVGTWFIAQPVMAWIAPEFNDSAAVLSILIVATGIIFIGNLFGNTIVAINRQKTMMWLYLVVAVASLISYLIFIPNQTYFGAAWVRTGSELLITIMSVLIVIKYTKVRIQLSVLWKSMLACGLMAAVLYLLKIENFFAILFIGTGVYLVVMFLIKGVSREVIREVTRIS